MRRNRARLLSTCISILLLVSFTVGAQEVHRCASEGKICRSGKGDHLVFYGSGNNWSVRTFKGPIACSNEVFGGDPTPGVVKACYVIPPLPAPCGDEGRLCKAPKRQIFVYGANGLYVAKVVKGPVACTVPTFSVDPAPGMHKSCYLLPNLDFESATSQ